jgi:Repeat of unknown function (DUF6923)
MPSSIGGSARAILLVMLFMCAACGDSTGPGDGAEPRTAIFASSGTLSILYRVGLQATGTDSAIGALRTPAGVDLSMTDLALSPKRGLWGITATDLYRIDAGTGVSTRVGALGTTDMNALAFAPDGRLFGARTAGDVFVIDTVSGLAQLIGSYGSVQLSGGDMAFAPDGRLFATVVGPPMDRLVLVNLSTGVATPAGTAASIGFSNVWGLVFVDDQLYGLTFGSLAGAGSNGVLLRIDPTTGAGTQVRTLGFRTYGAARRPSPLRR